MLRAYVLVAALAMPLLACNHAAPEQGSGTGDSPATSARGRIVRERLPDARRDVHIEQTCKNCLEVGTDFVAELAFELSTSALQPRFDGDVVVLPELEDSVLANADDLLRSGDRLLELDGRPLTDVAGLWASYRKVQSGTSVRLSIDRVGGSHLNLRVSLRPPPATGGDRYALRQLADGVQVNGDGSRAVDRRVLELLADTDLLERFELEDLLTVLPLCTAGRSCRFEGDGIALGDSWRTIFGKLRVSTRFVVVERWDDGEHRRPVIVDEGMLDDDDLERAMMLLQWRPFDPSTES